MQNYSLITSLVTGFGLALPFGYLAERFLRSPALVGYILAGVAVGIIPGLPPVNGRCARLAALGNRCDAADVWRRPALFR